MKKMKALSIALAGLVLFSGAAHDRMVCASEYEEEDYWDEEDVDWGEDGPEYDGYTEDEDDDIYDDAYDDDVYDDDDDFYDPEDDDADIKVEGGMGVFDASREAYIREEDADLEEDEFLSYYVTVRNNDAPLNFRIDGGAKRPFSYVSETEEGETLYHIDPEDRALLEPGIHDIEVIAGDEVVRTDRIYTTRDWAEIMHAPTEEQLGEELPGDRSAYISFFPGFDAFWLDQYSIDVSVDSMDRGTYLAVLSAEMDTSHLRDRGMTFSQNYGAVADTYCGFQYWEDGRTGIIMTVWDVKGKDKDGKEKLIKATPLYVAENGRLKALDDGDSGEGDFQQFMIEYPWKEKHPYRMQVEMGKNDSNGNGTLTLQVCDLISQETKKLITWDLGYPSDGLDTCQMNGFLENYLTSTKNAVRSVNLSNIRGREADTGEIENAKYLKFLVNHSLDQFNYVGSYQFGADESSYYAITSGVDGLCENADEEEKVTLEKE